MRSRVRAPSSSQLFHNLAARSQQAIVVTSPPTYILQGQRFAVAALYERGNSGGHSRYSHPRHYNTWSSINCFDEGETYE